MRIESVTAPAFGPLVGQKLELAPGLTVIGGGNESGKSSWHAALYAALCGRRRARGAPSLEDREFIERHRPWSGLDWQVSAVIVLDDGQRVEINRDLNDNSCRATDLTFGHDLAADLVFDGSPDASRYLGMDRKTFAVTASVKQAELLATSDAADNLQEHLQRAASAEEADTTAAAALDCLDNFWREQVGLDRSNSTKPLRTAKTSREHAEQALHTAQTKHDEYLQLVESTKAQRFAADAAAALTHEAEAARTVLGELLTEARAAAAGQKHAERERERVTERRNELANQGQRLRHATKLHMRFGGVGPERLSDQDATAMNVVAALTAWKSAPAPSQLTGQNADQLQAQIEALPDLPSGDHKIHTDVRSALAHYQQACAVALTHEQQRPDQDRTTDSHELAAATAAGPILLRELATRLSTLDGAKTAPDRQSHVLIGAALREARDLQHRATETATLAQKAADKAAERYREIRDIPRAPTPAASHKSKKGLLLIGGLAIAAIGTALIAIDQPLAGVITLLAGAGVAIAGTLAEGTPPPAAVSMTERVNDPKNAAAEAQRTQLLAERAHRDALEADRFAAEHEGRLDAATANMRRDDESRCAISARCMKLGVAADAARLLALADAAAKRIDYRNATRQWIERQERFQHNISLAETRLRAALTGRGERPEQEVPVTKLVVAYETACETRSTQAGTAARRAPLEQALLQRRINESAVAQAARTRSKAAAQLMDVAAAAAVTLPTDAGPQLAAAELTAFLRERSSQVSVAEESQNEWGQLLTLLNGATLDELDAGVSALRAELDRLLTNLGELEQKRMGAARRRDVLAAEAGVEPSLATDVEGLVKIERGAHENLDSRRQRSNDLSAIASDADGVLRERARTLPSVPEAEEALAAAQAELERVTELASILSRTQQFLSAAQERVHRNIAPILARTLRGWLPSVTDGRYTDVIVDPATLKVRVRGATSHNWRDANRLSIGTVEQILLLLRVALAQHLSVTGQTCPLLLDDVTVQADPVRTRQILDLLLRLSEDRQVVIFAQDPAVLEWAHEHTIDNDRLALRELARVTTD